MVDFTSDENDFHERRDLIELKVYVESVLGLRLRLAPWEHVKILPYALRDRYEFLVTEILGAKCLILKERQQREVSVPDIAKHMQAINNLQTLKKSPEIADLMIFVTDTLPSYDRKRLVEKGVQFIVPGNQLYLPAFGMDLREYYRQRLEKPQVLSPATQSMLIQFLIKGWQRRLLTTRSTFEKSFTYAKMTVTRAIKELADLDIIQPGKEMGEAAIFFHLSPKETWDMAKDYMRTPVKKTLWLNAVPEAFDTPILLAGEAALAEMSLLVSPKVPSFAMTTAQFDHIRELAQSEHRRKMSAAYGEEFGVWSSTSKTAKSKFQTTSPYYEVPQNLAACGIQFWSYDPLHSNTATGAVDPFSLYLSLKDEHDDRVQMCLDEMMENVKW
ncbi:hypothetical protein NYP20_02690 [Pseudomonas sp. N3-W]|uniref:MarR family transcriptional regulator n=1 Tax=Pseudomonas fungipugnans TaxID=3024217 RepID=A0ABT6QT47_9PSED|nr:MULTISPECIES: hypothetical protein [unclassified Pseudomonas]MDI2593459.1 hypothetical protein [Pseudomonas sp. 681]UWF49895.1 hypothetical protein NYP20_02690 [Pseudomonas sp. N3-W]